MLLVTRQGKVLLEKRPPLGVWGGLWSLPETAPEEDAASACLARYGLRVEALADWPELAHGFTHFRLLILPRLLEARSEAHAAAEPSGTVWLRPGDALEAAIPAPVRTLLQRLAALPAD